MVSFVSYETPLLEIGGTDYYPSAIDKESWNNLLRSIYLYSQTYIWESGVMSGEKKLHQRHLLQLIGFHALGDGHDDAAMISPSVVVRSRKCLKKKSQCWCHRSGVTGQKPCTPHRHTHAQTHTEAHAHDVNHLNTVQFPEHIHIHSLLCSTQRWGRDSDPSPQFSPQINKVHIKAAECKQQGKESSPDLWPSPVRDYNSTGVSTMSVQTHGSPSFLPITRENLEQNTKKGCPRMLKRKQSQVACGKDFKPEESPWSLSFLVWFCPKGKSQSWNTSVPGGWPQRHQKPFVCQTGENVVETPAGRVSNK